MKKRSPEEGSLRKLTRTGGYTYYVTLPRPDLDRLGWKEGQRVLVRRRGKKLVIQKKSRSSRRGSQ